MATWIFEPGHTEAESRPRTSAHLRNADFFDVDNHAKIGFRGRFSEQTAETAFKGEVKLTIRGVTRTIPLDIAYIGEWKMPQPGDSSPR